MKTAVAEQVAAGSRVRLHYTLSLADGTIVDDTSMDEPLLFTVGDGTLLPGLEACLLGMVMGQRGSYVLTPEQGYGYPDPDNIHDLPRDDFPADPAIEPGAILSFATPAGDDIPGTVLAMDEARVTVDFNHPLAGHTLRFAVEILSLD